MNAFIAFVRESIEEMRTKVVWPKFSELQQSSVLVLVASLIFAVIIYGIDQGFDFLLTLFYKSF